MTRLPWRHRLRLHRRDARPTCRFIAKFKALLSFRDHYSCVHLLDIEWLLSTLFDASLFRL
jgi:hypothetical protein